jgi:hypothetical protein
LISAWTHRTPEPENVRNLKSTVGMPEETTNLKEPRTTVSAESGHNLRALLLLALVSFTGIFLYSSFFGVYEDDYVEAFNIFSKSWSQFHDYVYYWCVLSAPQGRPVGWVLNAVVSYALGHKGSLEYSYLAGWLILTFNAYLLFLLLKKTLNRDAAIIGALFLLLLPFDLAKAILMHRVFVYGSITFLLLGLNLSNSNSRWLRWLSYPVAYLCLVTWEGPYLTFLFAPILWFEKSKRWIIRAAVHIIIWTAILGLTLWVRLLTGEDRAVALAGGGPETVHRMLTAVLVGPLAAATATIARPYEALLHAEPSSLLIGAFACFAVFYFLKTPPSSRQEVLKPKLVVFIVGSLGAIFFPYVLMYRAEYFPPTVTIGRLSALHVPAEVGFCFLIASIYFLVEGFVPRFRILIQLLFAAFFGCLMAFSLHIQKSEYVEGWLAQRKFWTEIGNLIPDVREGMHVVVDSEGIPTAQMFPPWWLAGESGEALGQFFAFPNSWRVKPEVVGFFSNRGYDTTADSVTLEIPPWSKQNWPVLRSGNFIFLREHNGELERVDDPVDFFGVKLTPKPREPASALKLTALGARLLRVKDSQDWPILRKEDPR